MAETIPLLWLPMFLHCVIGLVAAQVASRKGYDLGLWLLWGLLGGTIALIDALRRTSV
ncbi:hypothetical protein GFS31_33460 [Leptolyngbya sp. BL0902]|uniref:hypothetical protein n=1 Tax=Leptolyngbya sp. BL0902 TaxID=1115757 RepID=UPI0018E814D4|nr:hypothetical protein [Leptolyngbya sp. BL0902]QQE66646.1 hypothetical protein GFS31_33460 [Leptolyngbya sp. BL0902]